jgi:hypothetical protein
MKIHITLRYNPEKARYSRVAPKRKAPRTHNHEKTRGRVELMVSFPEFWSMKMKMRNRTRGEREAVKFMKHLVWASIRSGWVMSTWKEAKTIWLHKKGNGEDVENWWLIPITNCMSRIFTGLMAGAFQNINSKIDIVSDSQKRLMKKTKWCNKQEIMLNEQSSLGFDKKKRT